MSNTSPISPSRVRVLHVITPSHMGGAETFLARLLRRVQVASDAAASPECRFVHSCISRTSPVDADLRAAGIAFDSLPIGGKANLLALARLQRAARKCHATLLHSHLSSASWWCGWLEQLGGPPSVGHVHGFTTAIWHRWQSHTIACSDAVKRHLITHGIPGERITVMHYPVDPDDVRPTRSPAEVRAALGVDLDTPIVGTFAHLSPKKGYRELVQAAAVVLRRMPQAQFWCFGEGRLRAELEHTARVLGIADRFKLFGFRRDAADLMHAIDVMCLPSHREPFGLVYVEAALAEKPVIACNAGGAPEIIAHGESGLLISPPCEQLSAGTRNAASNIEPLAEAILELLDDRARAAAMGRRGREAALDRFRWPTYLARLNEVYETTLDRAVAPAKVNRQPNEHVAALRKTWQPQFAVVAALLILALVIGWGSDRRALRELKEISAAAVTYEIYNDRAAFEKRLAGATRWVDFDDIGTGCAEYASFEPGRYADRGIIIRGVNGQYVARTFGQPAEIHAVSQPNVYAPGPLGQHLAGSRTDVEFTAGGEPALVCGFGLAFVDLDDDDEDYSSIAVYDRHGRELVAHENIQRGNWRSVFRGIIAVDSNGQPVPVIASVRLTNGHEASGDETLDAVAMDDFIYGTPRPYR